MKHIKMIKEHLTLNWFMFAIAIFLFIALGRQQYGYYQFVHWLAALVAAFLVYRYAKNEQFGWAFIFLTVVISFNPIDPLTFNQKSWGTVDLLAAIAFMSLPIVELIKYFRMPHSNTPKLSDPDEIHQAFLRSLNMGIRKHLAAKSPPAPQGKELAHATADEMVEGINRSIATGKWPNVN